jgi:hypothetical protein
VDYARHLQKILLFEFGDFLIIKLALFERKNSHSLEDNPIYMSFVIDKN